MKDQDKTREQLVKELEELRQEHEKLKIICKEDVLANIIQEKNGNQYKKNNILEFKK